MPRRLLITAGPTHEPIDAVRFLGNRSSGTVGVKLANEALSRGWEVRILLGPVDSRVVRSVSEGVEVARFVTSAELASLLESADLGELDGVIMAAAVADYTVDGAEESGKLRRGAIDSLRLTATRDLLRGVSDRRGEAREPMLVGFALEPAERMVERATEKLERKGVDVVVANPLETLESGEIDATLVSHDGVETLGVMDKGEFACCLLDVLDRWVVG